MGGFLGFTVLVVNILEIPRLGAGTVSAVLVSSLVIFVGPVPCRSLIVVVHHRSICTRGRCTERFDRLAGIWHNRTYWYVSDAFKTDSSECRDNYDILGYGLF